MLPPRQTNPRVPSAQAAAWPTLPTATAAVPRHYASRRLGTWTLPQRTAVMGVLNVTPDSFSDGGHFVGAAALRERLADLVAAGADIIDVGAESTRPGAQPVPAAEQLRRLEPVLAAAADVPVPLSIDTTSAAVARVCLEAGFEIVNDVSTGADPDLVMAVAAHGAVLVLMHRRGDAQTMESRAVYGDVVAEVSAELEAARANAVAMGQPAERIWCDPGLGFAKTAAQSWELVRAAERIHALSTVTVWGPSRKRFTDLLGRPPAARDAATHALVAWLAAHRAPVVRVHDVDGARQAIAIAAALAEASA